MHFQITYPEKVKYEVHVGPEVTNPLDLFPDHVQKKILKSLPRLTEPGYYFRIEPVDAGFLEKFIPIYTKLVETKDRPKLHDIKDIVLTHPRHNYPYFSLNLYQNEQFLGGMIFSVRENSLVAAYKAYPHQLTVKLKTSISMLADYHYFKYALDLGKNVICNGRDRNIYGRELSIGLANYKISAGYSPYSSSDRQTRILTNFDWDKTNDILIMLANDYDQKITNALLLLKSSKQDFQTSYPELFKNTDLKLEIVEDSN